MKNLGLSLVVLLSTQVFASNKVIYGDDDRLDVFEETNFKLSDLAKSTAAMIPNSKITELNNEQIILKGDSLQARGMCASERFSEQPTVANCSGFLVGEDKLVTAGHCVEGEFDCKNNSWVFDYKVDHATQSEVVVDKSSVYKCKKVIKQELNSANEMDYALIELEKVVEDRKFLKVRKEGKPQVGDKLVVIGHPSGLPTKITAGAKVRSVNDVFLVADLDTYGGNSGSAVFNASTGTVEGILVRGAQDYTWDSDQGCRVSNVIAQDEGRGEDVTLITNIAELASYPEPQEDQVDEDEDQDDGSVDDGSADDSDDQVEEPKPEDPKPSLPWWLRWLLGL
tara:strand:- start:3914 stop:4930 length:1017 start_codon:yes stop_codon:yes gene_type:complete